MFRMSGNRIGLSVLLCLALGMPIGAQAEAARKGARQAKPQPLSAHELYMLYRDKTWTWDTGGGRFFDDGRRLVAWVNDKNTQYVAEGRWTVDNYGQLCMRAIWTNKDDAVRACTCFGHRKIGAVIYQRRQPDGKWYIFKHAKPQAGDEYLKLVTADTVSAKASDLKAVLTAGR
jgi:hypothetical protein